MPPFYIGSSSLKKVDEGYCGTVTSKKYKNIWWHELKENRSLFTTYIICKHNTRKEALDKECKFQKHLNVVKNPLYINQAVAAKNGYYGRNVLGKNNPMYGKSPTKENRIKQSIKMSGKNNPQYGKIRSEQHCKKLSLANIGKIGGANNHFYGKTGEKAYNHGKIWINDGIINKYHPSDNVIPEGWYKGMITAKKKENYSPPALPVLPPVT